MSLPSRTWRYFLMDDTKFLQSLRHLCLSFVDILERRLEINPRTAEIRRWYKSDQRQKEGNSEGDIAQTQELMTTD